MLALFGAFRFSSLTTLIWFHHILTTCVALALAIAKLTDHTLRETRDPSVLRTPLSSTRLVGTQTEAV